MFGSQVSVVDFLFNFVYTCFTLYNVADCCAFLRFVRFSFICNHLNMFRCLSIKLVLLDFC